MLRTLRPLAAAVLGTLLAGCGGGGGAPTAAPSTPPGGTTAATTESATASTPSPDCVVAPQPAPPSSITADFPTALAFAPDGRLFFAERSGAVKVWQNGGVHVFATVPTLTSEPGGGYSERGLLGLAVSPTFSRDRLVYAFYSDRDRSTQHVIRWYDCGGTGRDARTLITLPAGPDCCHKGGRIVFGRDGMLYVTLGDEHTAPAAQRTSDVRGKVLRYRPDGSVPPDNPFGPGNPVFAYGLRNPFGIAVSASGQIAVTNNGPSGDAGSPSTGYDTLVASLVRGGGYQWPLCYGYSHPLAGSCSGRIAPDWSSESSVVVPTGAAFVDASGPSAYAGHLVFCTLNRGMLVVTPGSPHASVAQGPSECRLDVVEGPDHALYLADTGRILRVG